MKEKCIPIRNYKSIEPLPSVHATKFEDIPIPIFNRKARTASQPKKSCKFYDLSKDTHVIYRDVILNITHQNKGLPNI